MNAQTDGNMLRCGGKVVWDRQPFNPIPDLLRKQIRLFCSQKGENYRKFFAAVARNGIGSAFGAGGKDSGHHLSPATCPKVSL